MKNNKLGVALILALVMIVQSFCGVSVFAQDAAASKTPVESAGYDLLEALGMLPDNATYYNEDAMTRGQFAYIAARLSGWNGNSLGETPFVDVADDYSNKDAITYLYNTNIVRGTGGLRFNPEGAITYIDATSIMIKILGYGAIATAKYGEYPLSHIRMGDSLDLDDDLGSPAINDALSCDKAITLLFNAAVAPAAVATSFGDTTEYSFHKKDTLLYTYYDIVKSEGVVTDDSVSAINGASTLNTGAAIISGVKLAPSTNGYSAKGLLGLYVDYYYVEDTKEFVYAAAQAGASDVLTITYDMLAPDNADFSITNIVYYTENDKIKNAKLATNVDLVYNGGAYPAFGIADLKIKSGYMTLIDRDTDKIYDAVNITEYDDVLVKGFDVDSEVIFAEGKTIKLGDYTQYAIRDLDGNVLTLDKLSADTIASIVASKDKSYVEVISCAKNAVQGPVTSAEITEKIYYVYDKGYELSKRFEENKAAGYPDSKEPEIGESYKLLLGADGTIVKAVKIASDSWYTGYCIGVAMNGSGIGESAKMRAMTPQGGLLDLYFKDKVKLNGVSGLTHSDLLNSSYLFATTEDGEKYPIRQPVKYRVDSWGKISEIETPVDNTTEDAKKDYKLGFDLENFSKDAEIVNAPYKADKVKALSGMYFLSDDSLIISDPYLANPVKNAYESEDVEILTTSNLAHGEKGRTFVYEVDSNFNVGIAVFAGDVGVAVDFSDYDNRTQKLFVVDKVMRKLDNEGEEIKVIAGYASNAYVEYTEYEEGVIPDGIKWGDVCTYSVKDNKLVGILVLKSLDTGDTYDKGCYVDSKNEKIYDNVWSTQYGPLYSVTNSSFVLVLPKNNKTAACIIDPLFGYSTNAGETKVLVLDRASKTMRPGTWSDVYTNVIPRSIVKDEDNNGNVDEYECGIDESTPRVFVYRRYSYAREIVFIK